MSARLFEVAARDLNWRGGEKVTREQRSGSGPAGHRKQRKVVAPGLLDCSRAYRCAKAARPILWTKTND
jgi:hypothetical protein